MIDALNEAKPEAFDTLYRDSKSRRTKKPRHCSTNMPSAATTKR